MNPKVKSLIFWAVGLIVTFFVLNGFMIFAFLDSTEHVKPGSSLTISNANRTVLVPADAIDSVLQSSSVKVLVNGQQPKQLSKGSSTLTIGTTRFQEIGFISKTDSNVLIQNNSAGEAIVMRDTMTTMLIVMLCGIPALIACFVMTVLNAIAVIKSMLRQPQPTPNR